MHYKQTKRRGVALLFILIMMLSLISSLFLNGKIAAASCGTTNSIDQMEAAWPMDSMTLPPESERTAAYRMAPVIVYDHAERTQRMYAFLALSSFDCSIPLGSFGWFCLSFMTAYKPIWGLTDGMIMRC